jgi:hypothetical protein
VKCDAAENTEMVKLGRFTKPCLMGGFHARGLAGKRFVGRGRFTGEPIPDLISCSDGFRPERSGEFGFDETRSRHVKQCAIKTFSSTVRSRGVGRGRIMNDS